MRNIALLLSLCLLVLLCACGASGGESAKTPDPAPTQAPAQTAAPTEAPKATKAPEATAAPAPTEAPAPEATQEPTEDPAGAALETAKRFIGKTVGELIAEIGEPESSDYAPSCLGPGEDGNLYYDGFTVYTYREDGVDTIRVVE